MNSAALGEILYRKLVQLMESRHLEASRQYGAVYELSLKFFDLLVNEEQLQFTTLFAKIAYIGHKYQFSSQLQYYLHRFRKMGRRGAGEIGSAEVGFALKVLTESIRQALDCPVPEQLKALLPAEWPFAYQRIESKEFRPYIRVLILGEGQEPNTLIAKDRERPEKTVTIRYNVTGRNDMFNPTIQGIKKWMEFPVTMNLVDVTIDQRDCYLPSAFVLEPDFLVDVSSVSESFKGAKAEISSYVLKKFWPFFPTVPLMLGNTSNYLLDELLIDPNPEFKKLFVALFELYPLPLSLFNDGQIKELYTKAAQHFHRLRKVLLQDLPNEGISLDQASIEPAFYSEKYGLQGRLDLFFEGKRSGIVELKSGKVYKPNIYGLGQNHFVQTLLYDLLIQSVYENRFDPANYILYSGVEERHLRFAPRIKAQQWEAIQFRNQIILFEKRLAGILADTEHLSQGREALSILSLDKCGRLSGFARDRIVTFENGLRGLQSVELKYFLAFVGFIAREHQLAKTGLHGADKLNGQAALWLENLSEKVEKFEIINHLRFKEGQIVRNRDHFLTFRKTDQTNELANFRLGDIAVLYPILSGGKTGLHHQIFKCTILEITEGEVTIRLRSKQSNQHTFTQFKFWNLEHDMLDSGFTNMYRSLFTWMTSKREKRSLLMGATPPEQPKETITINYGGVTDEQRRILQKALTAEDYFLLWGPPGTGKTSLMLKNLVRYLVENTDQNLLLMAYTNRAVDEICASISNISPDFGKYYFRVGSGYGMPAQFQGQLLKHKSHGIKTRKALRQLISEHRIVVGTLASIVSKPELLSLKQFDTAIIDEASQILEPSLVGLLPRFNKFILIGDHKQLPAVVAQADHLSAVKEAELQHLGFNNLRNSFFERLYKRCLSQGWDWAYDQLSYQGRMHELLMDFPSRFFYDHSLRILPPTIKHHFEQTKKMGLSNPNPGKQLLDLLCHNRMIFIDTPVDLQSNLQKTNQYEAAMAVRIFEACKKIYQHNDFEFDARKIGIITPFRAQIAQVRQQLQTRGILDESLTIDTVERYQGGARDIIIISLCTNSLDRLTTLTSFSDEGIDRKLNVALTRARQQLIILGNADILSGIPVYEALIKSAARFADNHA